MGYFSITPVEIESNFNIDREELMKYFSRNKHQWYLNDSNNYPIALIQLLSAYRNDKDEFLRKFDEIHNKRIEILKNNLSNDSYSLSDEEVVSKMLEESNFNNLELQSYAAMKSLKRVHLDLVETFRTDLYYTDIFVGKLHLYGNILSDTEGLNHKCKIYGVVCKSCLGLHKGNEYREFHHNIRNIADINEKFCENCNHYFSFKEDIFGVSTVFSENISFTDFHNKLMDKYKNISCLRYVQSRRAQKIPNLELFQLSKKMIEFSFVYQYPLIESSVFLLRQAIEVQIKNALDIDGFYYIDKHGKRKQEVGISKLLAFIEKNIEERKIIIGVNIKTLQKINKWLNKYIHTGEMEYGVWFIEWLHYYLLTFFHIPEKYIKYSKVKKLLASVIFEKNLYNNIKSELESFCKNTEVQLCNCESAYILSNDDIVKTLDLIDILNAR